MHLKWTWKKSLLEKVTKEILFQIETETKKDSIGVRKDIENMTMINKMCEISVKLYRNKFQEIILF